MSSSRVICASVMTSEFSLHTKHNSNQLKQELIRNNHAFLSLDFLSFFFNSDVEQNSK